MNHERNGRQTQRVSLAEREQWVRRYREGGLGLKRFAERYGLHASQLHYWIYGGRRPPAPSTAPSSPASLAPVFREVVLPRPPSAEWSAQISWPDGLCLRVGRDADPAWIGALLEHLRRPCSR